MGIFSKIFGKHQEKIKQPDIQFGRYTDAYKSDAKYDAWDKAIKKFEGKSYLDSIKLFFEYLRDDELGNVEYEEQDVKILFNLYQGSKKITGYANQEKFIAEGKIAKVDALNIGFLRRLLEQNFNLKYGRYCLDKEGDMSIVFDTLSIDGSPYKLYYALKEVSLAADKQDDILIEEFDELTRVNTGHIIDLSDHEKTTKAKYIKKSINSVLKEIESGKLNPTQYPGGITYLLLETIYRLDFLTRPEGTTMEAFERMHRQYFSSDGLTTIKKNHVLVGELKKILDRSDRKLKDELYRTISTFGIINPSNHERFSNFVEGELNNMDWYLENGYEKVALAIPGYICGYSLFSYSMPEPDRDFLLLYFQITEWEYFLDLGFQIPYYIRESGLQKQAIKEAIFNIIELHKPKYHKLHAPIKKLNFSSLPMFAKSYLEMVASMDLSRKE